MNAENFFSPVFWWKEIFQLCNPAWEVCALQKLIKVQSRLLADFPDMNFKEFSEKLIKVFELEKLASMRFSYFGKKNLQHTEKFNHFIVSQCLFFSAYKERKSFFLLLTVTLSLIPLSRCINSVVDRAFSDSCWRLCDSSVCKGKKSKQQNKFQILNDWSSSISLILFIESYQEMCVFAQSRVCTLRLEFFQMLEEQKMQYPFSNIIYLIKESGGEEFRTEDFLSSQIT